MIIRAGEATMTIKLVALVLLCLMSGTAVAQEPKVTSLMSKDLPEIPGREALMITVEHAPGGSSAMSIAVSAAVGGRGRPVACIGALSARAKALAS